jgi:hypothetical protein
VLKASLAAIVLVLAFGSAASAQKDSVVGVGAAVSFYSATDPNVDAKPGWGLVGRLRRGTGLGFSLGLGWFSADVRAEVDGKAVPIGTVSVRPLMGGVSYTRQYARYALTGGFVGGWSFNSISQTPAQQRIYGAAIGMPDAQVSASGSWVARPSVTFWYELHKHLAVFTSVGYVINRTTITTHGAAGQRGETVNLGSGVLSFGLSYGVF